MTFQQVYRTETTAPSRLEFIGEPWITLLAATSMAPTPDKNSRVDIYDVEACRKAATVFSTGRVSIKTEYQNVL